MFFEDFYGMRALQESAMGRPYSEVLRECMLGAIDNGENAYEIAPLRLS